MTIAVVRIKGNFPPTHCLLLTKLQAKEIDIFNDSFSLFLWCELFFAMQDSDTERVSPISEEDILEDLEDGLRKKIHTSQQNDIFKPDDVLVLEFGKPKQKSKYFF